MRSTATTCDCLIVGDRLFAEHIGGLLKVAAPSGRIRHVGGYLMALGEIAESRPTVVIGTTEGLSDSPEVTAAALRELVPEVSLLVVTASGSEGVAKRAVEAGFNGYIIEPATVDDLRSAISSGPGRSLHRSRVDPGSDPPMMGRRKPTARADRPAPLLDVPPPVADVANGFGYGDDLLVDQLLGDRGGLVDAALGLLAKRSGISDLRLAQDATGVASGCVCIDLEHNGQGLGVLWTRHAVDRARLEALGPWLTRWLALGQRVENLWEQALQDDLTGVWNRRYFRRFLDRILERAAKDRFRVTLMVYDLDEFKSYNDRYGHTAGDQILRETARLMRSVVREHDVVARIGGDEFAVIFWDADTPRQPNSEHPADVRQAAERFRKAVYSHRFPKLTVDAPGKLTISGGLASFPWDGRTSEELIEQADRMALQSKVQGKDAITLGPGAIRDSAQIDPFIG